MTLVWMLLLGILVGFFGAFVARVAAERGSFPWGLVLGALAVAMLIAGLWMVFFI